LSLPVPYIVYGYIYDTDGSTPLVGYTVTAESLTNGGTTTDTTDASGKYDLDLQDISNCEDGDSIRISISYHGHNNTSSFTLDLGSGFKNINITVADISSDGHSIIIYPSSMSNPTYIECQCTRWDESNYDLTIETFLSSGNRNTLYDNVVPGAVRELYKVLGKPTFKDSTYASANSLVIVPQSGYGVSSLREKRVMGIKSISDTFANKDYFNCKIEGKILSDL